MSEHDFVISTIISSSSSMSWTFLDKHPIID